jgi:hypothetical protein
MTREHGPDARSPGRPSGRRGPDTVTGKSVTEAVERYAFWGNGQEAVLTLSGPNGSDNVDPWRTITDSLRWQL